MIPEFRERKNPYLKTERYKDVRGYVETVLITSTHKEFYKEELVKVRIINPWDTKTGGRKQHNSKNKKGQFVSVGSLTGTLSDIYINYIMITPSVWGPPQIIPLDTIRSIEYVEDCRDIKTERETIRKQARDYLKLKSLRKVAKLHNCSKSTMSRHLNDKLLLYSPRLYTQVQHVLRQQDKQVKNK